MTTITDLTGYLASAMVLLTFMTKDMRLLRVLAIFSNVAFMAYGVLVWLPPVLCLHLPLLPVNILRLRHLLMEGGGWTVRCWPALTKLWGGVPQAGGLEPVHPSRRRSANRFNQPWLGTPSLATIQMLHQQLGSPGSKLENRE
jgi:hypothetical protein